MINPSNSSSSSHLYYLGLSNLLSYEGLSQILACTKKNIRIYQTPEGSSKGANFDQYRDCIDVAVKLGFGFNDAEMGGLPTLNKTDDFASVDVIRRITNNSSINKRALHFETIPTRLGQASDIEIEKLFYTTATSIFSSLTAMTTKFGLRASEIVDELTSTYARVLSSGSTHIETIAEVVQCSVICSNRLVSMVFEESEIIVKRLGEVEKDYTEGVV